MNYHKNWFANANQATQKKYKSDFYFTADKEIRITLKKRSEILRNNIFGVDIDREATEVAIMSLYLKLLDEGFDKGQVELFMKGHILPDMTGNIKCGNSLIDRKQLFEYDFFGDPDINPFDWSEFMAKGFDVILGNPPYIRIQEMQAWSPKTVTLYKQLYKSSSAKNYDIYVIFIEKAMSLLSENGLFGMILPNKFMQQEYGESIRNEISKDKKLHTIVNFKDFQVFKNATTYTCLLFLSNENNSSFQYAECLDNELNVKFSTIDSSRLSSSPWVLHGKDDLAFMDKLIDLPKMKDFCDKIFVGIQTSADKVYILQIENENDSEYEVKSKATNKVFWIEKKYCRHIISGSDVKKYITPQLKQVVIFPYNIINGKPILIPKKQFEVESPKLWEYILENKKILEGRESGKMKGDGWYGYVYLKNMALQNKPKICVPRLVSEIQAIYDIDGKWCLDNVDVGGVILKTEYQHLNYYIIGLLNSKLLTKYLAKISTPFRGGFWSCNKQYLEQLPIVLPKIEDEKQYHYINSISDLVIKICNLKNQIDERSKKDAIFPESAIDEIVEKLYGNI
jgi:hypothetical protein